MTPTPDWLITVLPFITLVVGAAITYVCAWLAEKGRTNREDKQRWYQDIRTITAEFIQLADRFRDHERLSKIRSAKDSNLRAQIDSTAESVLEWRDIVRAMQLKNTELGLIASDSVSDASRNFLRTLMESTDDNLPESDQIAAQDSLLRKEQLFVDAVKKELKR